MIGCSLMTMIRTVKGQERSLFLTLQSFQIMKRLVLLKWICILILDIYAFLDYHFLCNVYSSWITGLALCIMSIIRIVYQELGISLYNFHCEAGGLPGLKAACRMNSKRSRNYLVVDGNWNWLWDKPAHLLWLSDFARNRF